MLQQFGQVALLPVDRMWWQILTGGPGQATISLIDASRAVLAAMLIEDAMAALGGEGLAALDSDVMGCWVLG